MVPRSIFRIILAGLPATTWHGGTSYTVQTISIFSAYHTIPYPSSKVREHVNTYLGNNTPRPNRTPITHRHTGKNHHIPRNPAILADGNRLPQLGPVRPIPQIRIQRMRPAEETHVRPDERARPDRHAARVEDRAVEVDEDAAAHAEVCAVVDCDGPLDPGVCGEDGVFFFFCCSCGWERVWVVCYSRRVVGSRC
ncbi:hypothetical protein BJY01DRAFT_126874 [Aspergillus pseudoustus]|uniref:Uncharacterized protein n=1 Tax=Aspergillus pseudoustus TaxID=1810923 RepID=A0ABR4IMS2_9EURO